MGMPGKKKKNDTAEAFVAGKTTSKKAARAALAKLIGDSPTKPNKHDTKVLKKFADKLATPKNDAMAALEAGTAKKKLSKEERRAAAKRAVESVKPGLTKEIERTTQKLKLSFDSALATAMNEFMNTKLQPLADAFVALFLSNRDGKGIEASRALAACVDAFDGCGLILSDVETKKATKQPVAKKEK